MIVFGTKIETDHPVKSQPTSPRASASSRSSAPKVISYADHITPIPTGFDSNATTSILAGLPHDQVQQHQHSNWIVIPGAGGGLGHLVQYARVCSLHLVVIDTGTAKKRSAPVSAPRRGSTSSTVPWSPSHPPPPFADPARDDVKEIKHLTDGKGTYKLL
ncbi:hypothetical protein B0H17DRAFT_1200426 [Mycena rosella]|uniref:Alcohol dehydrogenase-like C-terminal domain-containing protein n=1 Tax=Mycena rosella TaxID=1033263 RepID=A0AAD7GJZ2_MYCRO|nr:hypothetical protein B0H17DRAFT_1200426 [Mycena rosella]